MGRFARLVPLVLLPWLAAGVGPALAEEDCKVLLNQVTDMVAQDSAILARVRDKLARTAELCATGENEAAVRLLREISDAWMPMGMGK